MLSQEQLFSEWLRYVAHVLDVPDASLTMALYLYIDESGKFHDGLGFINMCAFLSDDQGWDAFNKSWNALLRKHGFTRIHMTEFYSECRQRGWTQEQADVVLTEFIDTIRNNVLVGFAIGIDGPYFRRKYAQIGKPNVDPALFAVQRILRGVSDAYKRWDQGRNIPARVFVTFDEDESYSIACYRVVSRLRKMNPEVKRLVSAISFADDEIVSPLQAVNILANLTTRYWRERLVKGDAEWPVLLARLLTAPEPGFGLMWEPEYWDAEGIDRNWEDLRREQTL
jgi:uncharacterized protein DUF3800